MRHHHRAGLTSAVLLWATIAAAQSPSPDARRTAALQAERAKAMERVTEIVNQPVVSMRRPPEALVSVYAPGWFHAGAMRPDFDTVDIRRSQQTNYAKWEFVTSDISPDIMYRGAELEFNPMTKFFYTDRTVPKKKLTEAEMLEINDLYRVIGRCERELGIVPSPPPRPAKAGPLAPLPPAPGMVETLIGVPAVKAGLAVLAAAVAALVVLRRRRA